MKPNYSAWDIDINSFPYSGKIEEKIKFILKFAVLAPSGHNSQPWEFKISNDILEIYSNKNRSLEESDPEHRQLMIALGCMLGNIIVASESYGLKSDFQISENISENLIAKVIFSDSSSKIINTKNLQSILKRITNRGKYDTSKQIPDSFISKIKSLETDNIKISYFSQKEEIIKISEIVIDFQIKAMDRVGFRSELSHFLKNNWTNSKTGMIAGNFGIPAPITFFASKIIKNININKKTRNKDLDLIKNNTNGYLIISIEKESKINWLNAGIVFEKIWLSATLDNLALAPNAAPIQSKEGREEIQKITKSNFTPSAILRIGFPIINPIKTPRLSVEDVLG